MLVVRIIKNWKTPDILRQTPQGKGLWGNIKFITEPISDCDYAIILNSSKNTIEVNCSPDNVWAIMQEPYIPGVFDWMITGHQQFSKVFTHHIFTDNPKYIPTQTCLPWHVEKTYDELMSMAVPRKKNSISWITTNKTIFPGHKERMTFYEKVIRDEDFNVDIFGYGINPINDKWDALESYKYSLAIENSSTDNYWTEKLADCFLSYTLPIYYGCQNLDHYFPKDSFVQIDIKNFKYSKEIILQTINDNLWEKRLDAIIEARRLILNKYQFFPFIAHQIESENSKGNSKSHKETIILRPHEAAKTMKHQKPLISVIVCTYNRQDMLPACLDALINQNVGDHNYEVIIINNNSSDRTEAVALDYVSRFKNIKYFLQPLQGLSHARNMGIEKTNAEYIAYIDDDAIAPKNWIYSAIQIIKNYQPDIFGGPAYPIFPSGKPEWYKDEYGVRGDMGETGFITKGFIIGTNIFFKKELLIEYGGFDPELGMKGNAIAYHEETKIVYRAFEESRKVYYSKELAVKDVIPEYKLSLAFYIYARYKSGRDRVILDNKNIVKTDYFELIKSIDKLFKEFDYALMKRDTNQYKYPENYVIEKMRPMFVDIGKRIGSLLINNDL